MSTGPQLQQSLDPLRHLLTFASAAGLLGTVGLGIDLFSGTNDSLSIVLAVLISVSVVTSTIAYHSAFREVNFGIMALIVGTTTAARVFLDRSQELSLVDRTQLSIRDSAVLISELAAGVVMTHPTTIRSAPLSHPMEKSNLSAAAKYWHTRGSISSRENVTDSEPQDWTSDGKSVLFQFMSGPNSRAPSRTDDSGTTLSLFPAETCWSPDKTTRIAKIFSYLSEPAAIPQPVKKMVNLP